MWEIWKVRTQKQLDIISSSKDSTINILFPSEYLFSLNKSNRFHFLKDSFRFTAKLSRDFPAGPVVMTSPFNAEGAGSIPGGETKIPHASWQKNKQQQQKHLKH